VRRLIGCWGDHWTPRISSASRSLWRARSAKCMSEALSIRTSSRENILVDAASGGVWLTGFGIALRLPREHQAPAPPEVIAGTLAYMAPEQTGRMNRSVDSRSDLYACRPPEERVRAKASSGRCDDHQERRHSFGN
jgi:serine/threonine protein kinase